METHGETSVSPVCSIAIGKASAPQKPRLRLCAPSQRMAPRKRQHRRRYSTFHRMDTEGWIKNFGKSVKNRAPGMFMEILLAVLALRLTFLRKVSRVRKAENAGGSAKSNRRLRLTVDEFSTKTTKLSQYCHKCGKYTKKPLSQRVHTCCNLNIQRDIYSAFLAGSVRCAHRRQGLTVVENKAKGKERRASPFDCFDNSSWVVRAR